MKAPQRRRRRRVACLSLIWLGLTQGHAPGAIQPLPLTAAGRTATTATATATATAAAAATATTACAEPLCCSSRRGGALSPSAAAAPAAAAGMLLHDTGGASLMVPSEIAGTPDVSEAQGTTAARRLAGRELISGGGLIRRADKAANRSAWPEIRRVLKKCMARAGSGGLPGAVAGLLQVVTLMWLRTIVNYQCRYGTSMGAAATELYRQGGVLRFYRGVVFALVSNPLSRFGMAAANEGAMALTDALPRQVSVTFTTWVASLFAGVWRVVLTPLDTCKTVLQVEGPRGFASLMKKVWSGNLGCLYQGATAAAAATAVGYFPWFLTFNYLNARLRRPPAMALMLLRNAAIGLASSISSDVCSNSIRVLKTTKQAAAAYDAKVTYRGAAALVIEKDGLSGLFGRGLSTRILANGLQSMLFTVVWRYLHDKYVVPRREAAESREAKSRGSAHQLRQRSPTASPRLERNRRWRRS